jgi:hypothetical protein
MDRKGWGRAKNPWTVKGDHEIGEICNWFVRDYRMLAGIRIKGLGALQGVWAGQFASRIDGCCEPYHSWHESCHMSAE